MSYVDASSSFSHRFDLSRTILKEKLDANPPVLASSHESGSYFSCQTLQDGLSLQLQYLESHLKEVGIPVEGESPLCEPRVLRLCFPSIGAGHIGSADLQVLPIIWW